MVAVCRQRRHGHYAVWPRGVRLYRHNAHVERVGYALEADSLGCAACSKPRNRLQDRCAAGQVGQCSSVSLEPISYCVAKSASHNAELSARVRVVVRDDLSEVANAGNLDSVWADIAARQKRQPTSCDCGRYEEAAAAATGARVAAV